MSCRLALAIVLLWSGTIDARSHGDERVPTLFVIGDSTVRNGTTGQVGWGDRISQYFDVETITITNAARGGRSSRTYQTEGLWDVVLEALRPGDFVIMQFGHNDGSDLFTGTRPRGSIRGTGDESTEGTVETTGNYEVVHTFGWYMRKYIADTRSKGAMPIVCAPVPRNVWKNGAIAGDSYAFWARDVAVAAGAPFIDLNGIIARRYEELGPERVNALFPADHTHTNQAGADINASSVVAGLKALDPCPLCGYFSVKAAAVPAAPRP
jgi:lysophospholipase L1-like esterase